MLEFSFLKVIWFAINLLVSSMVPNKIAEKVEHVDYYTSMVGVQGLAKKEQHLVREMLNFRRQLQQNLDLVNNYLNDYKESVNFLVKSSATLQRGSNNRKYPVFESDLELEAIAEQTSANPILVFKLLRRFAKDLFELEENLKKNNLADFGNYISKLSTATSLPKQSDLNGAADGLLRLQETYQLSTQHLSYGRLLDKQTGCKLRAYDMHMIGAQASNEELYAAAAQWFYYAMQKVRSGDDSTSKDLIENQLEMIKNMHNSEFISFKTSPTSNLFNNVINSNCTNIPELYIVPPVTEYTLNITEEGPTDFYNFNALCRGEELRSPQQTKNLRCWYSRSSPHNVISPLKFEMYNEDPPVYQIYDLLSDRVIKYLITAASPLLKRAMIIGYDIQVGLLSDVRTSSTAWLLDRDRPNPFMFRIPNMVERATGLHIWPSNASEDIQTSCYGSIGGHFVPHLDSLFDPVLPPPLQTDLDKGDRITTLMFYLTDVELGGGTAFPRIGVVAKAVKGSAVLWDNLRPNGERDLLTQHGGCPVLHGNKWVANKWIRFNEQWDVRKCPKENFE